MKLLECIKDDGYDPAMAHWIKVFPVKGEVYTLRKREHTANGLGYLLEEIDNPKMPNGCEPNFSSKRFKELENIDIFIDELEKATSYDSTH